MLLVKYHRQLHIIYELYFQQDGAPSRHALRVRDDLNEVFLQRWLGKSGSNEWPPEWFT